VDKEQSERTFHEADRLYRAGRYPEAEALLRGLDAAHPGRRNVRHALALCLEQQGAREEALQIANEVIRRFKDPRAYVLKARLLTTPDDEDRRRVATTLYPEAQPRGWGVLAAVLLISFGIGLPVLYFMREMLLYPLWLQQPTARAHFAALLLVGQCFAGLFGGGTALVLLHRLRHRRFLAKLADLVIYAVLGAVLLAIPVLGWALGAWLIIRHYRLGRGMFMAALSIYLLLSAGYWGLAGYVLLNH